ncbi:MAG: type II toxin-antitoxin system RelE/ParE family toxin [Bacteroidota bacterium]
MSFNIIASPRFKKEIKKLSKKYPSLKNEFAQLLINLELKPTLGTNIGDNCFKIRLSIASKNKGKSGGARVITYVVIVEKVIYLLTIYDKSEQENISDIELKNIVKNI